MECFSNTGDNGVCCPKSSIIIQTQVSCDVTQACDEDQSHRSMDGSCNNLLVPSWGSSMRALGRLAAPVYSAGYFLHSQSLGVLIVGILQIQN